MRVETIHPSELGPAEIARWRSHQGADLALASPYLTPEWALLMGQVRPDARICVLDGGAGFLGVQLMSRFAAMGLGAPIADHQGAVGGADLEFDSAKICRALGVGRIDLANVPAGQQLLAGGVAGAAGSWIAETSGGRDLYEAALKQRRSEFVRQMDKKQRKLAREQEGVEFRAASADRADFETLLAWKNAQLKSSGQPQIWAVPWVRRALNACFEARAAAFGGVVFSLSRGGQLIAGAFCLRAGSTMNLWLIAHDPVFDAYSPGVQLTRRIVGWAGEHGLAEVEFGPGDYQYKRQLATTQRTLQWGAAATPSFSGALRRAQFALRAGIERLPHPRLAALPGKAMRRLDLMRALAA